MLEAAHISPYMGTEANVVSNDLLLRADLHTLYDRALTHDFRVVVAPELKGSKYAYLEGRMLRLPSDKRQQPSAAALTTENLVRAIWERQSRMHEDNGVGITLDESIV